MATTVCVVAAKEVIDKSEVSYAFMIHSKMPTSFSPYSSTYGRLLIREKGEDKVNPFRLARGEQNAIGPDGLKEWVCYVGGYPAQTFFMSTDEDPGEETGLQRIMQEVPDSILLVEEEIIERLTAACTAAGVELVVHHFDGVLQSSYPRPPQPGMGGRRATQFVRRGLIVS